MPLFLATFRRLSGRSPFLSGYIGRGLALCALTGLLAGCATPPPDDDPDAKAEFEQTNDPLEPTNRAIFDFNDTADTYVMRPLAEGYRAATPEFARNRIADLMAYLKSPAIFGNDLLQANFSRAGVTLSRFLLNTSFGVFGIMDVATPMGLPGHEADFGETLAVWGVGDGPYLVLPLLGPSNIRDAIGGGVDSYTDPFDYYLTENHMKWASWGHFAVSGISKREAYLDVLDDVKRTSLDYYSAMRSLSRQRRTTEVMRAKSDQTGPEEPPNAKH